MRLSSENEGQERDVVMEESAYPAARAAARRGPCQTQASPSEMALSSCLIYASLSVSEDSQTCLHSPYSTSMMMCAPTWYETSTTSTASCLHSGSS